MCKLLEPLVPPPILTAGFAAFKTLRAIRAERPAAEIRERVWRVQVEEVVPRRLAPPLKLNVRAETPDLLEAATSGSGRVAQVAVRDGDRVSRGDLLV